MYDTTPIGPEWELVETVCRVFAGRADPQGLEERLRNPDLAWGIVVGHLLTHKLSPLAASVVLSGSARDAIPKRFRQFLRETWTFNGHRQVAFLQAATAILDRSAAAGVPLAARKGLALEYGPYGGKGARVFFDLDFLTFPDAVTSLAEVLEGLDYVVGEYDSGTGTIVQLDRKTVLRYRLNPDHLPRYVRSVPDPLAGHIEVDIATSLTWTRSGYDVPLAAAFASIRDLGNSSGSRLPVLSTPFQFVDLVMHLFREAFVESTLEDGNPVTLSAFLDVLLLWDQLTSEDGVQAVRGLIASGGLERPVSWVLHHLDRLFDERTGATLGMEEVTDDAWAASWRTVRGTIAEWSGDMRARLHSGGTLDLPARETAR
jgi:hypothetical protein